MAKKTNKIIGIDLGTTNSVVSVMDGEKLKLSLTLKEEELLHQLSHLKMAKSQ